MTRKLIIITTSIFYFQISSLAHGSWEQHAEDMYNVFGLERNEELTKWMKFVSSVLIDNNNADSAFSDDDKPFNFYSYLQDKYPGFQCKHRLLFHWGYNSKPWSPYLEDKVQSYGWSEEMIQNFQADLIAEQKRRNRFANEYTENVFGLAHGGKDARIARVMISIAYDVHLLGDYEPDNTDLDGLQDIGSVVGDVINNLYALDKRQSSDLCKQLRMASLQQELDVQEKANRLLNLLKKEFRGILQLADNGRIADHLRARGFRFEDSSASLSHFETRSTTKNQSFSKEKRIRSRNGRGIGLIIISSLTIIGVLIAILLKK